jgi:hypothetical protein
VAKKIFRQKRVRQLLPSGLLAAQEIKDACLRILDNIGRCVRGARSARETARTNVKAIADLEKANEELREADGQGCSGR